MNRWQQSYQHIRSLPAAFWVVIAATLLNQVGNMGIVFLLLYLTHYLEFSLTQASFAFATFSGAMIISGLLGGSLVDGWGSARTMIITLIANGLILIFFSFIHHYWGIMLLCLLWGLAYGLNRPASQAFVGELSLHGKYKLNFSLYRLALNLGMSIGPAMGGYLATHFFPSIYFLNGLANLLASLILVGGLLSTTWLKKRNTTTRKLELNMKWLKKDPALRLFVLGMIPMTMVFYQHESTLAVFLENDLHIPILFYGWLFTLNTLIIVFCELPLNVATLDWPYRYHFMMGSFFITIGFFLLFFSSKEWHILMLASSWTLGEMLFYPSATSYIADIAPSLHRGNYMAWYSTCSNIGMLLGPWGGAILMQHWGAANLWLVCGGVGLLSIFIFYFLKEPTTSLQY